MINKSVLKYFVSNYLPAVYYLQQTYRIRRKTKSKFWEFQKIIRKKLYTSKEIKVLYGPFSGMNYFNEIVWGSILPKWIGSYEEELHDIIYQILNKNYKIIIDIGAAEGYYAVGLARSCKNAKVYSFDIDPFSRRLQRKLASLNNIKNLTIGKNCSERTLNSYIQENDQNLIICDIEGFEYHILDPILVKKLIHADILVETHSFSHNSKRININQMTSILKDRFSNTHQIVELGVKNRNLSNYPALDNYLNVSEIIEAVNEHRVGIQKWLWIQRKSKD